MYWELEKKQEQGIQQANSVEKWGLCLQLQHKLRCLNRSTLNCYRDLGKGELFLTDSIGKIMEKMATTSNYPFSLLDHFKYPYIY